MSELVWGIALALLAGTVIPWATKQASAAIEARRTRLTDVQRLYEQIIRVNVKLSTFSGDMKALSNERNELDAAIRAHFALFDGIVDRATRLALTYAAIPEAEHIMRLWVNGNRWTARWLSWRLMRKHPEATSQP